MQARLSLLSFLFFRNQQCGIRKLRFALVYSFIWHPPYRKGKITPDLCKHVCPYLSFSALLIAFRKLPAGFEPATPSLRVKCTTDCAKEACTKNTCLPTVNTIQYSGLDVKCFSVKSNFKISGSKGHAFHKSYLSFLWYLREQTSSPLAIHLGRSRTLS